MIGHLSGLPLNFNRFFSTISGLGFGDGSRAVGFGVDRVLEGF